MYCEVGNDECVSGRPRCTGSGMMTSRGLVFVNTKLIAENINVKYITFICRSPNIF